MRLEALHDAALAGLDTLAELLRVHLAGPVSSGCCELLLATGRKLLLAGFKAHQYAATSG